MKNMVILIIGRMGVCILAGVLIANIFDDAFICAITSFIVGLCIGVLLNNSTLAKWAIRIRD